MPHRMAFCSACDRPVPVMLKSDARSETRPAEQDAEDLVCLDYRIRCTGSFCPMFSVAEGLPAHGGELRSTGEARQ